MKKSWGFIPKIIDGRKRIESRWGKNRCAPWGKIKIGDVIYFKNVGEPVVARAKVSKIMEFEGLNPAIVRGVMNKYGGDDGISIHNLEETVTWARNKRYCTLIFLKKVIKVKPFLIDKRGFGAGAAWLTVPKINQIRITS